MQNTLALNRDETGRVPCRVAFILARQAPVGVIFRRGPTKWVQLLKWDVLTDVIEPGQWFHGRIYDRRSDLSPSGKLLIYFAQKITGRTLKDPEYTYAWTAISKPPYWTALALWPKGDCWHGGGLFTEERKVMLNHKPAVAKPHPEHKPQGLKVIPNRHATGEDDPIFSERLTRDGWNLLQEWEVERCSLISFRTLTPEVREKHHPLGNARIRLVRSISGLTYSEQFSVVQSETGRSVPIDRANWVDWDHRGRLVFAQDGKLFAGGIDDAGLLRPREIVDLNPSRPQQLRTPWRAKHW